MRSVFKKFILWAFVFLGGYSYSIKWLCIDYFRINNDGFTFFLSVELWWWVFHFSVCPSHVLQSVMETFGTERSQWSSSWEFGKWRLELELIRKVSEYMVRRKPPRAWWKRYWQKRHNRNENKVNLNVSFVRLSMNCGFSLIGTSHIWLGCENSLSNYSDIRDRTPAFSLCPGRSLAEQRVNFTIALPLG